MQPADNIRRLIHQSQITSSAQVDRRILADALADLEKRRVSSKTDPGVWRILMHSKTVKLAAAAVIVIAVLFGLQLVGGSGVTFAQAIQPILDANTAIFDIVVGEEKEDAPIIHDMVMGSYIRRTLSNAPGSVSIIDLEASRILSLDESKKQAVYVDLKGLPPIPNYLDHLKTILGKLQDSPHFATEELGVQQFDGRDAVGFRMKHPKAEIVLWADCRTGLPVRIEQHEGQLTVICKHVQFGAPMDASLFSMEVPEGYKLQETQLDLLGSTEENFVEGLRVLAERYGDGQFPDDVTVEYFLSQVPAMQKKEKELNLSDEEEAEIGTKVQKHLLFLRFFQGQGKWYYRGKGVQLGDASAAIFWYRPKGSTTYRVVYGDLHVEDVAVENLPEPLDPDDVSAASIGYQQWSKPEFVGQQEDLWQIRAGEQVTIQSDLMLMKGPEGVSTMPITLPYATGTLTSVSIADTPVAFRAIEPGRYELQLPVDLLLAGQTKVTCTWTLPLADLEVADFGRRVLLRSLIPVVSYALRAGLDEDCGYELTEPMKSLVAPSRPWALIFTSESPEPKTDFNGTCGITMRKRP